MPLSCAEGYLSASRRAISPVPQPTSTMRAAAGSREKIGSSCGQIASACAARLRTIDSSAISFACELFFITVGSMAVVLTSFGAREQSSPRASVRASRTSRDQPQVPPTGLTTG